MRSSGITAGSRPFSPLTLTLTFTLTLTLTLEFPLALAHLKLALPFKSLPFKSLPFVSLALGQHSLLLKFKNNWPFWIVLDTWSKFFTSCIHVGMRRSSHIHWPRRLRIRFRLTVWPWWWNGATWSPLEFPRMLHGAHRWWRGPERLWCSVSLHFRCHVHAMRRPSGVPCFPRLVHFLILFGGVRSSICRVLGRTWVHSWRSMGTRRVGRRRHASRCRRRPKRCCRRVTRLGRGTKHGRYRHGTSTTGGPRQRPQRG